MSLFTTIGDTLDASTWYQAIRWTFWTMLVILAWGGVHTARFGKKKLIPLAIQGCLKLTLLYLIASVGHICFRPIMAYFSDLPFLVATDESLSLMNPLALLDRWKTDLPVAMVHLYALLFFINLGSVFDYSTPNVIGWLGFQLLFGACAVGLYGIIFFAVSVVMSHWNIQLFYNIVAMTLGVTFLLLVVFKFIYTFIAKGGSRKFQVIHDFLTKQKFGQQFTVTALSFLFALAYLVIAAVSGHNHVDYDSIHTVGAILNGLMCVTTLYIYNRYYNG